MTLDEAIERYTNNAEYERMVGNLQGCLDFRQLAEWLSELEQLRKRIEWIPTSERLPNVSQEEDEMLITLEDKDGERDVYKGFYEDGLWWVQMYCGDHKINLNNPQSKVVAWMPLLESYKGESEDA